MLASGCTGWNGGASDGAIREMNVRLNRRIAARIENLPANYFHNFHVYFLRKIDDSHSGALAKLRKDATRWIRIFSVAAAPSFTRNGALRWD
jgi:hypothetical protein